MLAFRNFGLQRQGWLPLCQRLAWRLMRTSLRLFVSLKIYKDTKRSDAVVVCRGSPCAAIQVHQLPVQEKQ